MANRYLVNIYEDGSAMIEDEGDVLWAEESGGATGFSVPGVNDDVFIDENSLAGISTNESWQWKSLTISTYEFNVGSNNIITVERVSFSNCTVSDIKLVITGYGDVFYINNVNRYPSDINLPIKFTNTSNNAINVNGILKFCKYWFDRGSSTGDIVVSGSNSNSAGTSIKDTGTAAHNLKFGAGSHVYIYTFEVNGSSGKLITLTSTTTGTFTLDKINASSVPVNCEYLDISHCIAQNGTFNATHSIDHQSIATAGSGWNITGDTVANTTNFFSFFN